MAAKILMLVFVIMLPGRWVYKAMSLVASTRGLALMPAYAKNLLPWSVVSRPLEGEAPTIDLAVGYSKANTSPILKLFLSRIDDLTAPIPTSLPKGVDRDRPPRR